MPEASAKSKGYLIAAALTGAWREFPPSPRLSAEELEGIAPLLLGSGAGALAWNSLRTSHLRDSPIAELFREAYQFYSLQSSVHELQIQEVFKLLRSGGVEPLLIKGWAVAQLYPDKGLRPSGDIDICVRADQRTEAEALLGKPEAAHFLVDLIHEEITEFDRNGLDQYFDRSQLVRLGNSEIRVPCAEDHLRLLCIHFLKHGGCLPRWLCDIAAAVESSGPEFDWPLCLSSHRREGDWIGCAISLAHRLLEADLNAIPKLNTQVPKWIVPSVVSRWETLESMGLTHQRYLATFQTHVRQRHRVLKAIYDRWPNPLEATIRLKAPLNALPRLPFQLANCWLRATEVLKNFRASNSGQQNPR
ncbi:MAG TPA: nucleotidyltransferase family protein [Pyrinomonadaceae bacterium]|nr:nucleotidyltransferase family protein [Pyrinomonadaceae bacterium]